MQSTDTYILLPDGTWAVLHRGMDWGELAILVILVALLFLKLYELWSSTTPQRPKVDVIHRDRSGE